MACICESRSYLDVYPGPDVRPANAFVKAAKEGPPQSHPPLPTFEAARGSLPQPFWEGHEDAIAGYWKAWELAFRNLALPSAGSGFIAPFSRTAFNDQLFLWDSVFILAALRFAPKSVFHFQGTLDNLYCKQHADGFISREVCEDNGQDRFHRHDPPSTGPNVLAWSEFEYYKTYGDAERLRKVYPVLLAYHRWMRKNRTWPDGSYHSCGLACGMDNQPRTLPGFDAWTSHSFSAWVDATAQALLSASTLARMAAALGVPADAAEVTELTEEAAHLRRYIRAYMWDEEAGIFCDRRLLAPEVLAAGIHGAAAAAALQESEAIAPAPDGSLLVLSRTHTVGAYWTLLAGVLDVDPASPAASADGARLSAFLAHLEDPRKFNRPIRIPSLAADHPDYKPDGGYWLGGVWAPTVYMTLRGLSAVGAHDLAADIAANYHGAVTACYRETGTYWENYCPESGGVSPPGPPGSRPGAAPPPPLVTVKPGNPAKADFVGWSALGPIAVLLEYRFGIRADVPAGELVWDIRLTEAFGVTGFPFGGTGLLDLEAFPRASLQDEPIVAIKTNVPLRVRLRWGRGAQAVGGLPPETGTAASTAPVHEKVLEFTGSN